MIPYLGEFGEWSHIFWRYFGARNLEAKHTPPEMSACPQEILMQFCRRPDFA